MGVHRSLRVAWAKADDARLKKLWPSTPGPEIARIMGRSYGAVKARANVLGLKKPRFVLDDWARAWMIALYPHLSTNLVAFALGVDAVHRVYAAAKRMGLAKTEEYLASPDACRLQPGNTPANKGIKGWQAGGRAPLTQFKKGNRPQTYQPIGSISYSQDGFPRRKIADPNKWEFCHRAEWQKHHGPIPRSHVVSFKNGDRTNWSIENLELLTFAENLAKMRARMLAQYGPELIATKKALTRLRNKINEPEPTRASRRNRRTKKGTLRDAARR